MSAWIYAAATVLIGASGWTAYRMFSIGEGVKRWPAQRPVRVEPRTERYGTDSTFAAELHGMGVKLAAANHQPLHLAEEPEPGDQDPAGVEQPDPEPAPEYETEVSPDKPNWWGLPPQTQERAAIALEAAHHVGGEPTFDLAELEFTNSWNRAALIAAIHEEREEAA